MGQPGGMPPNNMRPGGPPPQGQRPQGPPPNGNTGNLFGNPLGGR